MPHFGPTGDFPFGTPLRQSDQGSGFFGVRVIKEERRIIMDFGTMITWLAIPMANVTAIVQQFRSMVKKNFGDLPYDTSTLPIKVTTNHQEGIIELVLPTSASVLIANPETILALADIMEDAIRR